MQVIVDLLSANECRELVAEAERRGFSPMGHAYPPSYRNNDRLVHDDPARAAWLFERLVRHLPRELEALGARWSPVRLNERFRFCRYRDGQRFGLHRDGAHAPAPDQRSLLTVMIYLNDGSELEGGQTRFYDAGGPSARLVETFVPRTGAAALFAHDRWHDGAPVVRGTKYVMRSDVVFRRMGDLLSTPRASLNEGLEELERLDDARGYVWALAALPGAALATGSRDGAVRIYRRTDARLRLADTWVPAAGSVTALAHGGGALWAGGREGRVCVRDEAGIHAFEAHEGAVLTLARAGDRILSGGADGRVRSWSAPGRCLTSETAHDGWVWDVGAGLSAGEDAVVRVDGKAHALGAPARAVARTPGGFVAGLATGEVAIVGTGARRFRPHEGAVTAVLPLPDGRLLSGGEDGAIHLFARGHDRPLASAHHDDFVRALLLLDERRVASASYDGTVRVWRISG